MRTQLKVGINRISEQQKRKKPLVSVIIPTYKRGHLLKYVLEALTKQTSNDFEVLVIVKPSGDDTEKVVEEYSEKLKTRIIKQNQGYFTDALNLGIANVKGEIIVFLDDDAIPFPDLIQSYITSYTTPEIGGVAGDVIPVALNGDKLCHFKGDLSEILPKKQSLGTAFAKFAARPLKGLDDYLIYVSKAGFVSINYNLTNWALNHKVNSLLAKGANMSISAKAAVDFKFPKSWLLGLTNEQYLGWYLWKKGYRVRFNPEIKAYHIYHEQALSRNVKDAKKEAVLYTEGRILFYRLYGDEPGFSLMNRLVFLLIEASIELKGICLNRETFRISRFKNKFFAELLGLRWLVYKKIGSNYSPLQDLEKMLS